MWANTVPSGTTTVVQLTDRTVRMSDIVDDPEAAANTIHEVQPEERRRLILDGTETAKSERAHLRSKTTLLPLEPGFMSDMPALAEMAGKENAVEVLVGAGMLMLAGEIRRLRQLNQDDPR